MNNVRLTVLLIAYFFFAAVCIAEAGQQNKYDAAVTGGVGGLGGSTQRRPHSLTGGTWAAGTHTFAYSIAYRQQLRRLLSGSVTYINQGHYDDGHRSNHHSRDNVQVEVLLGKRPFAGPIEFKIGGGGAYYSATDRTDGSGNFQNRQGFGLVLSGIVDVDISNRLFLEARTHRHLVLDGYPSTNVLLGMGFRLQTSRAGELTLVDREEIADRGDDGLKHAIRINYGLGILNSTNSEPLGNAFRVAYERRLSKHFAAAISYLHEGTAPELNRKGVAIQGEVRQELGGLVTLGVGLGPYINVDRSDFFQRKGRISTDALFTVFVDLRVNKHTRIEPFSNPASLPYNVEKQTYDRRLPEWSEIQVLASKLPGPKCVVFNISVDRPFRRC